MHPYRPLIVYQQMQIIQENGVEKPGRLLEKQISPARIEQGRYLLYPKTIKFLLRLQFQPLHLSAKRLLEPQNELAVGLKKTSHK